MPEPVSTVGLLMGYAALYSTLRSGSAVSPEAQAVRDTASAVVESAEKSVALFGGKAVAISELRTLANECAEENWDGNGAYPLESIVVLLAEEFLRALPDDLPLPEFAPEPDGSISLDWIQSRTRLFSLSIGRSQRLSYAWLDGSDKGHAVSRFDREQIPARILQGIREIVNHAHSSLRAA
jgi:hypothetical protein